MDNLKPRRSASDGPSYGPDDPQRSKRVRVVLDSGSQQYCITEQLQTKLGLQPKGEQCMSIVTFGSRGEKSRRCPVIEVRLDCGMDV